MQDIMIKIYSVIQQLGDEASVIEFTTEGKFYKSGKVLTIMYKETEVSGMEGAKTSLKIDGDVITMKRLGSGGTEMVFENGKRSTSAYMTPYGEFQMEMRTRLLENCIEVSGDTIKGYFEIDYNLVIKNLSESKNHLRVSIL